MVVQHNLRAMNSNRMLGLTASSQSKSTEKLSSGYKINRAADDAAGLAISEKMRKQIRGLTQASLNAQDGISAVQTAEGALTEVHDMLQRMNELAVKSANGTNSKDDRSYIQAEIKQLITEINRVSTTTKFNETYLLNGDEAAGTKDVYFYRNDVTTPASATITAGKAVVAEDGTPYTNETLAAALDADPKTKVYATAPTAQTQNNTATYTAATLAAGTDLFLASSSTGDPAIDVKDYFEVADDGTVTAKAGVNLVTDFTITAGSGAADDISATVATYVTGTAENYSADTTFANSYAKGGKDVLTEADAKALVKKGEKIYTTAADDGTLAAAGDYSFTPAKTGKAQLYDENGKEVSASDIAGMLEEGKKLYEDKDHTTEVADLTKYTKKETVNADLELSLHVGADSSDDNKISLSIVSMGAASLGVTGLDVSSEATATAAIDTISEALKLVSAQRSDLGAIQNRLEHTINNLDNVVENTTAAEAQIRDTDMATEMVKYSNNNILAQAGQAMLAQSNQANQGVLSLLQ